MDTGVREGDEVSVFYDPMIAKLIVWGDDRAEAARRMQSALASTTLLGVTTNREFLVRVLEDEAFARGDVHTGYLDEAMDRLLPPPPDRDTLIAVLAAAALSDPELRREADLVPALHAAMSAWRN